MRLLNLQRELHLEQKNGQRRAKSGDDEPRLCTIRIDRIVVGKNHRPHDADAINDMAVSIREVGVITPVLLQHAGKTDDGRSKYLCKSGALRIHGAKEVGYTKIGAIVLNGDEDHVQLCGIAVDLFRDDLTVLQQAEFLKDWLVITRKKGEQNAQPGGQQPRDKGLSKAAKALSLSRRTVSRLEAIGDLSPEIKAAIKAAKLDDSKTCLLAITKAETDEKQLKKVEELRHHKNAKKEQSKPKKSVPEASSNTIVNDADFENLKTAWDNSPEFVTAWKDAPLPAREQFIKQILRQSTRESATQADMAVGNE